MATKPIGREPVNISTNARHFYKHKAEEVRFDDDVEFCLSSKDVKAALIELCGLATIWERVPDVVPASSSKTCDIVPISDFAGIKYIITAYNNIELKYLTFEMLVSKKGTGLVEKINSKMGDQISINVDVTQSGSDLNVDVTNLEGFDLTIGIARMILK